MTLVLTGVALAGCGGSGNSKEDKAFLNDASSRCATQLSQPGVFAALDATKLGSPNDNELARAQAALTTASQQVEALSAPSDKRKAQGEMVIGLRTGAASIAQYLSDRQMNESHTTEDWNSIVAQLSALQQTASDRGMRACAIPVT